MSHNYELERIHAVHTFSLQRHIKQMVHVQLSAIIMWLSEVTLLLRLILSNMCSLFLSISFSHARYLDLLIFHIDHCNFTMYTYIPSVISHSQFSSPTSHIYSTHTQKKKAVGYFIFISVLLLFTLLFEKAFAFFLLFFFFFFFFLSRGRVGRHYLKFVEYKYKGSFKISGVYC